VLRAARGGRLWDYVWGGGGGGGVVAATLVAALGAGPPRTLVIRL